MYLTETAMPSVQKINKNFVIRWRYSDEINASFDRLIGAGKYEEKFGARYMEKNFLKAWESGERKTVFKIRNKYIITFISR